ncbi:PREDICTED: methyltransferase-like protein 9 [Priapulus caudatus]|uniref:Methyltransferase-like protein 9 n=1 Tax=Priapulus caudatus TaxID=37621 RepID=A0ABM1E926_PRICU|nr:PREDICTED: methyltransferase-like protein 9 [Priapulus caudatus]
MQSSMDASTNDFLENCYDKADWFFTQIVHATFKSFLCWFMSSTSANGFLGRGSMFVMSTNQLLQLMGANSSWRAQSLLDLGAGDGRVTQQMAPLFTDIYCTETSSPMQWRLNQCGYKILGVDEWHNGTQKYDLVSCLNLLDRCKQPATMLRNIKDALVPETGRLLLATVIPFEPYVEADTVDHTPSEFFHIEGRTFEEQVNSMVRNVFEPAGFVLERFTRVPYLCEGDLHQSIFWLDDALFLLRSR